MLIPLLFMGDVVGRLFREFAVTLAVAILISAVVSLTLTPMMCAKLLKHTPAEAAGALLSLERTRVRPRSSRATDGRSNVVLDHQPLTLLVAVATLVLTVVLYIVDARRASSRCRTPA